MTASFTNRDRQREESRERLFQAALEIFRRDGFRAARVDDITLVAGLSRTSFYFHFPTKEDVLVELNHRLERPVLARVEELGTSSAKEVLAAVVEQLCEQWREHRPLAIDAMTVGLRLEAERSRSAREGSLRFALSRHFERCIGGGELVRTQPPEALADAFLLHCLSALTVWGSGEGAELDVVLKASTELFLHGVLAE